MRPGAIRRLPGQFCGAPVGGGRLCLREPGHDGAHDGRLNVFALRRPPTREERLERDVAIARELAERRARHVEHLKRQVRALEERRAWVEGYIGFRVEYRLRGLGRRLRRVWREFEQATRPS